MLVIFSTPELIRNLWQLKIAVFPHWCLICALPFSSSKNFIKLKKNHKIRNFSGQRDEKVDERRAESHRRASVRVGRQDAGTKTEGADAHVDRRNVDTGSGRRQKRQAGDVTV
jgi:hypothetical protein